MQELNQNLFSLLGQSYVTETIEPDKSTEKLLSGLHPTHLEKSPTKLSVATLVLNQGCWPLTYLRNHLLW